MRSAWPPITCTGRLNVLECRHVKFVLQRHLTIQPSNLPPHLTYLNSGRPNGFDAALADLIRFDFLYVTMSNVYRALYPSPPSSIGPGQDERKTNWKRKVSLRNNPDMQTRITISLMTFPVSPAVFSIGQTGPRLDFWSDVNMEIILSDIIHKLPFIIYKIYKKVKII